MSDVLILFASFDGQAERIALRVGEVLGAEGHAVRVLSADHRDAAGALDQADAVIVGGAIRTGRHARYLERLVRAQRGKLAARPNAFFSVSLSAHGNERQVADAERCVQQFVQRTGWKPQAHALFAGALQYSRYNFLVRFAMRLIVKAAGGDTDTSRDYEYTDWAAVEAFARRFARGLALRAAA